MKVKTLNGNINIIGNNLRKYRQLRKISQPEICRKLDLLGVTMYNSDIYEIEYGKKTVKDFEILAFCKVLEISLEDLYFDTEKYYEAWKQLENPIAFKFYKDVSLSAPKGAKRNVPIVPIFFYPLHNYFP